MFAQICPTNELFCLSEPSRATTTRDQSTIADTIAPEDSNSSSSSSRKLSGGQSSRRRAPPPRRPQISSNQYRSADDCRRQRTEVVGRRAVDHRRRQRPARATGEANRRSLESRRGTGSVLNNGTRESVCFAPRASESASHHQRRLNVEPSQEEEEAHSN